MGCFVSPNQRQVRLFVSYSHENAVWFRRLLPVLKVKANIEEIKPWHDSELQAGDRWDSEIRAELERMDIFLCLVSYQFLASDYIRNIELPKAEERYRLRKTEIIPVLLYQTDLARDCPFLRHFNPLPAWGKTWREYEQAGGDWNDALCPIGHGIKQAVDKVRARGKHR